MENESVYSINQQTSRVRHTQQLHRNEIDLDSYYEHEKHQVSESRNSSSFSFNALHFRFLALTASLSSVSLIPKIHVLHVSVNRQDVIVFVQQSDSIADVSIQRR